MAFPDHDTAEAVATLRVAMCIVRIEVPGELARLRETVRRDAIVMSRAQALTLIGFAAMTFIPTILGLWQLGFVSLALALWGASWARTEASLYRPWRRPVVGPTQWRADDSALPLSLTGRG